ncbi:hypothetical protein BH09PAT2_BH09PAT2_01720 [soil metagenome]
MIEEDILLFKTIFEQTPISTQIFTPDGETLMVNEAWEELWHIKFEQLKSYNILKDQQLAEKGILKLIKRGFKGEVVDLPAIQYVPSESVDVKDAVAYRWLQAKMYPIRNAKNKLTHLVLQHEDITIRKEIEENSYRLAAIVESSDDAIISKTLDGIITSWNNAATSLFGYTPAEAIGKHITMLIPPELRSEEEVIISKIRKGKRIQHYETIRVDKYKRLIPLSLTISPVKDNHGTIIGASKIARNISDQIKAAQALHESEERLRLALDASKIGVWDWDIIKNKLTWTNNVYSIHAVSPKTFIVTFENFAKLIHPEDKQRTELEIQNSLKEQIPFETEFRIITPSGQTRWLATRATTTYADGKPVRMLGATSNITQQKQLEQDKSDFLSMASHELKTPLTSMLMFIELLRKQIEPSTIEKAKYFTKRIHEQANRLTELTSDLLDVSRIETGKLHFNIESFPFDELIQETIEGIQPTTENHNIIMRNNPSMLVKGDRYRLYQVMVNLLTNAIKYSPKGGDIVVTVKKSKNTVTVSIQDFGIGIKKEAQERIFDRLYQVTDPEEKTYPGLGLGLYISKEIITRHNGRLWVESEKGQGSTFYFSLPIQ